MPGLSGLDLQDRLNAMGRRFPIIFITATVDDNTRTQALTAGAFGYLIKPFDEDELLTCIRRSLQHQVKGSDPDDAGV
jgi:FixJ family two-component response regulator